MMSVAKHGLLLDQQLLVYSVLVLDAVGHGSREQEPMQRDSPGHSFSPRGRLRKVLKAGSGPRGSSFSETPWSSHSQTNSDPRTKKNPQPLPPGSPWHPYLTCDSEKEARTQKAPQAQTDGGIYILISHHRESADLGPAGRTKWVCGRPWSWPRSCYWNWACKWKRRLWVSVSFSCHLFNVHYDFDKTFIADCNSDCCWKHLNNHAG